MSEQTVTATIEHVSSKEGAKNGKPWRKWSVKAAGELYSTFDAALGDAAHGLSGQRATIIWKPSGDRGQFRDLVAISPADGLDASAVSSRTEAGQPDWDLIGLHKTRCALWAAFLGSPLAAAIPAEGNDKRSHAVYVVGRHLVEKAERDIFWREPARADSDVEF